MFLSFPEVAAKGGFQVEIAAFFGWFSRSVGANSHSHMALLCSLFK
jgi:hypothetical protein